MSSPLASQILVSIFEVSERRIDHIVALICRGHAEGHIDDAEAELLYGAAQLRRSVFEARRTAQSRIELNTRRRVDSDSEKRRTWSASGALPPRLRCRFTSGENAVAAVIRTEIRRHGFCVLPYSVIARIAGLASTTVVKRFVREARRMRLVDVKERPVRGDRHKPNIITIVSRDWKSWNDVGMRGEGGGTAVPPYQNTHENNPAASGNDSNRLEKKNSSEPGTEDSKAVRQAYATFAKSRAR